MEKLRSLLRIPTREERPGYSIAHNIDEVISLIRQPGPVEIFFVEDEPDPKMPSAEKQTPETDQEAE